MAAILFWKQHDKNHRTPLDTRVTQAKGGLCDPPAFQRVLKHASRSRHIDPDRPPAAAGGLRSQVPDLVHGPRELLDCRQLQQAGRRERTRFFDRRSRAGIDLAASAIIPGRQSLN